MYIFISGRSFLLTYCLPNYVLCSQWWTMNIFRKMCEINRKQRKNNNLIKYAQFHMYELWCYCAAHWVNLGALIAQDVVMYYVLCIVHTCKILMWIIRTCFASILHFRLRFFLLCLSAFCVSRFLSAHGKWCEQNIWFVLNELDARFAPS